MPASPPAAPPQTGTGPPDANTPPPTPAPAPTPPPAATEGPQVAQPSVLNLPTGITATLPDDFSMLPGGGIKITAAGRVFNLERPGMPQFLSLRNGFQEIVDEDRKYRAEHDDVARDQTEEILGWVNTACVMLSDAGLAAIPEAKVPPWLGSANLVNDMLTHWREVPGRK